MTTPEVCPAWCTDHTGFDDSDEDWHKTQWIEVGNHRFYISTGSLSGAPEVFLDDYEGVPLADAQHFAQAILAAIEEVRSAG